MTLFVRKLFYFLLPLPLLLLGLFGYYLVRKQKVDASFERIAQYNTLLMGDSQLQRINPALFPDSTFNFASSAEHYFFTYQKLAHLLSLPDNNIRTVVLGASVHSFAPVYNRMNNLSLPEGKASLKRFMYFLDQNALLQWASTDFSLKYTLKGICLEPDWGGFYESTNTNPDTAILRKTFDLHYKTLAGLDTFSWEQLTYLRRIVALCKAKKVELVLVATPYHPLYQSWITPAYKAFFYNHIASFQGVLFLDYSQKQDKMWMSDANHLNRQGALKFTRLMVQDMANGAGNSAE